MEIARPIHHNIVASTPSPELLTGCPILDAKRQGGVSFAQANDRIPRPLDMLFEPAVPQKITLT
jgi:hypothetical protein